MPNIRLQNTFPNIVSKNTTPNLKVRNDLPNIRVQNLSLNIRVQNGGSVTTASTPAVNFAGAGYPIGILMAITYSKVQVIPGTSTTFLVSDFKPSIRITNI